MKKYNRTDIIVSLRKDSKYYVGEYYTELKEIHPVKSSSQVIEERKQTKKEVEEGRLIETQGLATLQKYLFEDDTPLNKEATTKEQKERTLWKRFLKKIRKGGKALQYIESGKWDKIKEIVKGEPILCNHIDELACLVQLYETHCLHTSTNATAPKDYFWEQVVPTEQQLAFRNFLAVLCQDDDTLEKYRYKIQSIDINFNKPIKEVGENCSITIGSNPMIRVFIEAMAKAFLTTFDRIDLEELEGTVIPPIDVAAYKKQRGRPVYASSEDLKAMVVGFFRLLNDWQVDYSIKPANHYYDILGRLLVLGGLEPYDVRNKPKSRTEEGARKEHFFKLLNLMK